MSGQGLKPKDSPLDDSSLQKDLLKARNPHLLTSAKTRGFNPKYRLKLELTKNPLLNQTTEEGLLGSQKRNISDLM